MSFYFSPPRRTDHLRDFGRDAPNLIVNLGCRCQTGVDTPPLFLTPFSFSSLLQKKRRCPFIAYRFFIFPHFCRNCPSCPWKFFLLSLSYKRLVTSFICLFRLWLFLGFRVLAMYGVFSLTSVRPTFSCPSDSLPNCCDDVFSSHFL